MKVRHTARRVLAATILASSCFVIAMLVPLAATPSQGATNWVRGLSDTEMLRYSRAEAIAAMPYEYRRAILAVVDNSRRAAYWQLQFRRYAESHKLTAAQATLLKSAASLVPVVFSTYSAPAENAALWQLEGLRREVASSLGPAAERELFLTGGSDQGTNGLPLMESLSFALRRERHVIATSEFLIPRLLAGYGPCGCSQESDWCDGGTVCKPPEQTTYGACEVHGGCGTFFMWTCNGICAYPV